MILRDQANMDQEREFIFNIRACGISYQNELNKKPPQDDEGSHKRVRYHFFQAEFNKKPPQEREGSQKSIWYQFSTRMNKKPPQTIRAVSKGFGSSFQ